MLNNFRSLSGSIWAKLLLILLVLSFAIWGIDDMVRQANRNAAVAHVGDSSITSHEFNTELRRTVDNMRQMLGDHFSPEMIRMINLPGQVLQRMVDKKLLALESEQLGIVPSDADVVRHIRSNPLFQDKKGNFDKSHFEAMLRNNNLSEKTYVDRLRRDMASDLLVSTLLTAVPVSGTAAKTLLQAREEQRHVTLYTLSPALVSDVPQPDDKAITDYYNTHSQRFTAPEYRNLSYVVINGKEAKAPAQVPEAALRKAYEERIEEFRHPERRKVEQLLYSSEDKAQKAQDMLKSGTAFEQVAQKTDIVNKGALELGNISRNAIIENAADQVFSLKTGEHTSAIPSPFGWHIFRVTAIEPASVMPFEEARPALERELAQRYSEEAQSKLANTLEDKLAGGSTLQEAAQELGLTLQTVGPVNKEGDTLNGIRSPNLPELDKFLDTAFKIQEKTQSSLISSKGGQYYIVQVDNIVPERLRALDEVRGLVVAGWQDEQKAKHLSDLAKTIAAQFRNESARAGTIAKYGMSPRAQATIKRSSRTAGNLSLPAALVADVFSSATGKATGAYLMDNGNYMVAVINQVIPMPPLDKNPKLGDALAEIRSSLKQTGQQEILSEYTRYLATKYDVSVNEAALDAVMP